LISIAALFGVLAFAFLIGLATHSEKVFVAILGVGLLAHVLVRVRMLRRRR
jgi:hypothetical protein